MRKKMRRTYPRKQGMEYIHGGNKMLKLSLKQGQYVNIGDNIRSFHRILLISCCASLEMPGSA